MRYRRLATVAVLAVLVMPATVHAAPPIAGNDNATTDEDTAVTIDLYANDSDPEGDILDIADLDQPASGFVQFTETQGVVTYTPFLNFNGLDRFFYTVVDGNGGSATATVAIFVTRVNDPPRVHDRTSTVVEDASVSIQLQALDPDKEECDLIFTLDTPPEFGNLGPITDGGCSPNGDWVDVVYTPLPGYHGPDSFTYLVSDGTVELGARVDITVTPVDDVPVALAGSASTSAGAPVSITLSGYDWETCELVFAVAGLPANGTVSSPGSTACGPGGPFDQHVDSAPIAYTPAPGFSGADSFTFTVSDGTTVSVPASVSINVIAPPTVHVGDLDAATVKGSGSWHATVTVRIDTWTHAPRSGAVVRGVWGNGLITTCTTSAAGSCSVGSGSLPRKVQSTTFRVTSVTIGDLTYDSAANHDPDGSSNGTQIAIVRP